MLNTHIFSGLRGYHVVRVGLGALLIAAMFFVSSLTAHAVEGTCFDITGKGTEVLVDGVPNSGVIHFSGALTPDDLYEACSRNLGLPSTVGPFQVKGWAWNDNLGWVSFFCGDEDDNPATPRTNAGIPCGAFDYGVTMDGTGGPHPGRLNGYAWGDNIGWISMNCKDAGVCATSDYAVQAETEEEACIGAVFGAAVPAGCSAPNPSQYTYAWSDNVGWINFAGVTFPWDKLLLVPSTAEFNATAVIQLASSGVELPMVDVAPVADGADDYRLLVNLAGETEDGQPVDMADYAVNVEVTWEDTVDFDQTDEQSGDYSLSNNGALRKPFTLADFGSYGAEVPGAYSASITSLAPTSNENVNSEGFDNQRFIIGGPGYVLSENAARVVDVKLSVIHIESDTCDVGEGEACDPVPILKDGHDIPLRFKPAVELYSLSDTLDGDTLAGDTIAARHNVANTIGYMTRRHGALAGAGGDLIRLNMGVNHPFELVYDANADGADCTDPSTLVIGQDIDFASPPGLGFDVVPVFAAQGEECLQEGPPTGQDAYIYSEVAYQHAGKTIKYFSDKLPRVEGTLVVNPVAEIQGNVHAAGLTNPQTGQRIFSLGDITSNFFRDRINRNVEQIVAGAPKPPGLQTVTISGFTPGQGFVADVPSEMLPLLPDEAGAPRAYYFSGDVRLESGADTLGWEGERTIIVKGGNVFVNSDLWNPPSPVDRPALGIIVLKDLAAPAGSQGGNLYIGEGVTNVQANMFVDGTAFSYGVGSSFNENGEPFFFDEIGRRNLLKDQLYIEGSLSSNNTIGGAVANPPIIGDGSEVSAVEGDYEDSPMGRSRARLYDLNFLRYYGLAFERTTLAACPDQIVDQQNRDLCPGEPGYQIVAEPLVTNPDSGDLIVDPNGKAARGLDPDEDFAPVYITFVPVPEGLPGFWSVGGGDIRVR